MRCSNCPELSACAEGHVDPDLCPRSQPKKKPRRRMRYKCTTCWESFEGFTTDQRPPTCPECRKKESIMKISDNRQQVRKLPVLGDLGASQVYEYIDQGPSWARDTYVRLNGHQHYLGNPEHGRCWVLNLKTCKVCCHKLFNQITVLEAEMVINGEC